MTEEKLAKKINCNVFGNLIIFEMMYYTLKSDVYFKIRKETFYCTFINNTARHL